MSHEKRPLTQPVLLTRTRYIGFSRTPVRDDSQHALISGLPTPSSDYRLLDGKRFIDAHKRPE